MNDQLETLKKELQEIDNQWLQLIEKFPDDQKQAFLAMRQQLHDKQEKHRQEQEALIKRCHPTNDHWPPHSECPICQMVIGKIEMEAKILLGLDAADPQKLEDMTVKLFEERYLKGWKSDASDKGQS